MAHQPATNDPSGLHARIAELEAEVARLQQVALVSLRDEEESKSLRLASDKGHVTSGFAAAADRREIVAGWANLAASEKRGVAVGLKLAELEAVYQVMPIGLAVLDSELRYVRVNDALARLNGVPADDHVGRTIREIVPEVADGVEKKFRNVFDTGEPAEPVEFEASTLGTDGKPRVWLDNVTPLKDAQGRSRFLLVTVVDITNRKRIEEALRQSEARFRAAVQAVSGVVWTNNAAGRMEGEQPGWAALTGQTFAQYQGYGWSAAVHADDAEATLEAWRTAVACRGTFISEHRLRCADGRWRRFAVRAIPVLVQDGTIHEWVGVHTDVSAQREAEAVISRDRAELEQLVEQRTAALLREVEERRRVEEAMRQGEKLQAIGQLTGGIAHDFNNILQVILSGTTLLSSSRLVDERRARILTGISESAERAKALTGRLLAFARKQTLMPEPCDVIRSLQGMSDLLRQTLGSRIRLETDFEGETWLAQADPNQLETAVLNLAVNARDAMLPQGGTITLQTRNAYLEATSERAAGEYVCLAVKDIGPGIPPAVLRRVFEPFFTTKEPDKGTGLGLAQVHGFAKQSGGDIAIESVLGQGTAVTLHLPRATLAQVEAAAASAPRPAASGLVRTSEKTVLVVDDNPDVAAFTGNLLEESGFHACRAHNADEALALINAGKAVDAVFSDVVMPGEINGLQMASILHEQHPHIAVVLATGYSEVLADWGGRTSAEVLRKPYRLDDVVAALDRAFMAVQAGADSERGGRR